MSRFYISRQAVHAEQLLRETAQKLGSLQSLQADATLTITMEMPDGPQKVEGTGKAFLARPNLAHIEMSGGVGKLYVSDGALSWRLFPDSDKEVANRYMQSAVKADGENAVGLPLHVASYFFRLSELTPGPKDATLRSIGQEKFDGRLCEVVERSQFGGKQTDRFYIGPDRLLYRAIMTLTVGKPQTIDSQLRNLRLNPRLDPKLFVFPLTDKLTPFIKQDPKAKLLEVGAQAPDFTLPTPNGTPVALAEARAGKRAVLLNFWYYNCGPCQAEMPVFQKLYAALREQGLEIIGVDNNDTATVLRQYAAKNNLRFPIVQGDLAVFSRYGILSYPTNYLIGPDGKVLWRGVGYDSSGTSLGLKPMLEKLGFRIPEGIFK